MQTFKLTRLEAVISGAGAVAALGEELERRGARRAVVITGASLGRSALLSRVTRVWLFWTSGIAPTSRFHSPMRASPCGAHGIALRVVG